MDSRYCRDQKTIDTMNRCIDGFQLVRTEVTKLITEARTKVEDPKTPDHEIRSYLGQIRGLKKALDLLPTEPSPVKQA
jgi:hypothetical protein